MAGTCVCGLHKMRGICCIAVDLLASQEIVAVCSHSVGWLVGSVVGSFVGCLPSCLASY